MGKQIALLGLALLAIHGSLRADLAGAQEAYKRGMQLEKTKNYQAAISEYEGALLAEPRYVYAYKQIGTCKYYLGDKAGALEAYDQYLATMPNDAAIKSFADKLRAQGASAGPSTVGVGLASGAAMPGRRWNFDLDVGYHLMSMKAINDNYALSSSGSPPVIDGGYSFGGSVGYFFHPKMQAAFDIDYYLVGVPFSTNLFGIPATGTDDFSFLAVGPAFRYDFVRSPSGLRFGARLGLDFITLLGAGMNAKGSTTLFGVTYDSKLQNLYSGSGVMMKFGGTFDWPFSPSSATFIDVGYRLASISKVDAKLTVTQSGGGSTITFTDTGTLQDNAGKDLVVDYSGIDFKIGVRFGF